MSLPKQLQSAVASPFSVKLYQLIVGSTETEPDLIQSQIRFFFLYRKIRRSVDKPLLLAIER